LDARDAVDRVDQARVCKHAKLVVDTRNAMREVRRSHEANVVLA